MQMRRHVLVGKRSGGLPLSNSATASHRRFPRRRQLDNTLAAGFPSLDIRGRGGGLWLRISAGSMAYPLLDLPACSSVPGRCPPPGPTPCKWPRSSSPGPPPSISFVSACNLVAEMTPLLEQVEKAFQTAFRKMGLEDADRLAVLPEQHHDGIILHVELFAEGLVAVRILDMALAFPAFAENRRTPARNPCRRP